MLKSKINVTHWSNNHVKEMSVAELIKTGGPGYDRGELEHLRDKVDFLEEVITRLIERSGLSDQNVLDITGTNNLLKLAKV